MVTRPASDGRMSYLGAWLDDGLMAEVARWMTRLSGIGGHVANLPEGVEASARAGDGRELLLLVNHSAEARALTLPAAMTDQLTDQVVGPDVVMAGREVMVLAATKH
jgi:beta-galactosidase